MCLVEDSIFCFVKKKCSREVYEVVEGDQTPARNSGEEFHSVER